MGLLSFDEYGTGKKNVKPVKEKRSVRRKRKKLNEKKKQLKTNSLKKVNESSFQVGDDYKVKITLDVPISLVKEYIDKVNEETGKNPLDNFSESELAEQMVDFIVKQNLVIDNLPSNFSVGDQNVDDTFEEEKDLETAKQDAEDLEQETGDSDDFEKENDDENKNDSDGLTGMTDNDLEDGGDDEEELDFDGEEIELGEDIEVDDSEDKKETKEEEESLNDLFEKIGYKNN